MALPKNEDSTNSFVGLTTDFFTKINLGQITMRDLEWFNLLTPSQREYLSRERIFKRTSGKKGISLPATNGTKTLQSGYENAFSHIAKAHSLELWYKNVVFLPSQRRTDETLVDVFELQKTSKCFIEFLGAFHRDLSSLLLTQEQIISFVERNKHLILSDTLFFNSTYEELLVVIAKPEGGGIVSAFLSDAGKMWRHREGTQVVIPRLAP